MPKKITHIVLHDSDSPFGNVHLMNQWHQQKGFEWIHGYHGTKIHVGYHYIIGNGHPWSSKTFVARYDGLMEGGRPEEAFGAHCKANGRNRDSIGICLIGPPFTTSQLTQCITVTKRLMEIYGVSVENVVGHKEQDPGRRSDPRFDMGAFRQFLT